MTEWDDRQLCPDGACVGVIGPDGTCKVCGRAAPGWGDERQRGLLPPTEPTEAGVEDAPPVVAPDEPPAAWDERTLCPDGACIGVIGDDGRCTVCGKPADAQAS